MRALLIYKLHVKVMLQERLAQAYFHIQGMKPVMSDGTIEYRVFVAKKAITRCC